MPHAPNVSLPNPKPKREGFRPMTGVPQVVNFVFWILMALEVVHAANIGVYFVTNDFSSFLEEFNRGWLERETDAEAPIAIVAINFLFIRVFLVGLIGFFVWTILLVRRGVNWARWVTTISAAAGLLYLFPIDFATVADAAANIVAVVLLWLPTSRAFFDAVRVERGVHKAGQFA